MSTSLRAFKGITLFSLLPLVAACTEATSYPENLSAPFRCNASRSNRKMRVANSSVSCGRATKPISAFAS